MKKLLLITLSLINITAAFCQGGYIKTGSIGTAKPQQAEKKEDKLLYGPLPYRTLQETIGETYIVLPIGFKGPAAYYHFLNKKNDNNKSLYPNELSGTLIKLQAIDQDGNGHFINSLGTEYISTTNIHKNFPDITPVRDIDDARKLFINQTLWMKDDVLLTGDPLDDSTLARIKGLQYQPVTIIDIAIANNSNFPVMFICKTANGETGYLEITLSGTNTSLNKEALFKNNFFSVHPQKFYGLTNAEWLSVKQPIKIGMSSKVLSIKLGTPDKINTTKTARAFREQWVYGRSYYYFENGKLVSYN